MSDAKTYEARVQIIQDYNQVILDGFRAWLGQSNLSKGTINRRISDLQLFALFLVYYDDPLKNLVQANGGDVWQFLSSWYPRKVSSATPTGVKSYLVTFKKFFQWMEEAGYVSPETVSYVLMTLKQNRNKFLISYLPSR